MLINVLNFAGIIYGEKYEALKNKVETKIQKKMLTFQRKTQKWYKMENETLENR